MIHINKLNLLNQDFVLTRPSKSFKINFSVASLLHFVRTKNVPFSTTNLWTVVSNCETCAEVKQRYFCCVSITLIKAVRPMERICLDFKGPFASTSGNSHLLIALMNTPDSFLPSRVIIWQRKQSYAVSINSLSCVEQQDLFIPPMGQPLCLGISRSTCLRGALHQVPVVFTNRLKWAGRETCWHSVESSAVRIEKAWAASIALGSCFGGYSAFCAVVIMHC